MGPRQNTKRTEASRDRPRSTSLPDAAGSRRTVYVHPGQLFVGQQSDRVVTILGSCVAACIFDPVAGVGGLCHFVLPAAGDPNRANLRFGKVAVPDLIRRVIASGGVHRQLRAKLFGGACILRALRGSGDHLGLKNARLAQAILAEERISVVASDLGGERGRKVVFHPDDGLAWVRRV